MPRRKSRAPRAKRASLPGALGASGLGGAAYGIGRAASASGSLGGTQAGSYAASGLTALGGFLGGPQGFLLAAAGVSMQALSGLASGRQNFFSQTLLGGVSTGIPTGFSGPPGMPWMGSFTGQMGDTLNGLAGMRDKLNLNPVTPDWLKYGYNRVGFQAAAQGATMTSPFLAASGNMGQFASVNQAMIQHLGSPVNPAFQGAAQALAPAFADPFLNGTFSNSITNNTSLGSRGVAGALLALGPSAGFSAVAASSALSGHTEDLERFRLLNRESRLLGLVGQTAEDVAAAQGYGAGIAGLRGNNSTLARAFRASSKTYEEAADIYQQDIDLYKPSASKGDPYSMAAVAGFSKQKARAKFMQESGLFQAATVGPSADWINRVSENQTEEAIAMMDPMRGIVPTAVRRGLISDYATRLSEIQTQTAGNPAAAAALSGERSNLRLSIAQEQLAARYGIIGQALNIGQGTPSGYQALGLRALTASYLQSYDEGVSPREGGTGKSIGGGATNTTIARLLTEIRDSTRGDKGTVGTGKSSLYSLVNNRANRKMGGR